MKRETEPMFGFSIGRFQFKGNIYFWISTAFFAYISYASHSPWPILGWVGLLFLCCLFTPYLKRWDEKQRQKLLADFPNDYEIQTKYGGTWPPKKKAENDKPE
jgi:Flp pilus assembly protein TadB